MSKKINWWLAPSVPTSVLQMQARGEPLHGTIVSGPLGQKTFIPFKGETAVPAKKTSVLDVSPGNGLYASVSRD
jgi:hypothetical protein